MDRTSASAEAHTLADVLVVARAATGRGVVDESGRLVEWSEVADRVDRLARALHALDVRRGDRVAVLLPKSLASFVAVHAALRAGAVAVPLDPLSAKYVLSPLIEVTAPRVVLSTVAMIGRSVTAELDLSAVTAVWMDDDTGGDLDRDDGVSGRFGATTSNAAAELSAGSDVDLGAVAPSADDDAYIIYTSGSTGRPKGIVHTHRSGLAYARSAAARHRLDADSRLAGTTPLHFDMSTLELYAVPLASATAVTVTESDGRFAATLATLLDQRQVTHLYAVPTMLHQLAEHGALGERDLSRLSHLAFGGEPMGTALLRWWMAAVPNATFLNVYGPAEVNAVTSHEFDAAWDGIDVPIGRPWPDVEVRVVDGDGADVAPGEPGELLVAAPSCMRGYWQLDEATAARTTVDGTGARWYHTGDIVCADDGVLYFRGRRDNQVKVRGVRIEVEAVERVLSAEPSVAQAVVERQVDEAGVASLTAWIVPVAGVTIDERAVSRWCRARLPVAAVPSRLHQVASLPVTPNGKLDRSAVAAWTAALRA